jgi:lipopolysaccharide transport system permease protein
MQHGNAAVPAPDPQAWEVRPGHPGPLATLVEIWRYRRLLPFLAARALQKIYRRTLIGWLWVIIIPLFPITLRAIVFGALLDVPSDGVPYILFIACGSLIWDLFAQGLTWGTRALDISGGIVEQLYVPRAIIPVGGMLPAVVDFAVKLVAVSLIVAWFWIARGNPYVSIGAFGWTLAALLATWIFALGLSFFTSVWGEQGRDARMLLGYVLSVWYLLTPVLYPVSQMPESWQRWVALNPMAPLVETFKWSLFGVGQHDPRAFAIACAVIAGVFAWGLTYFARLDAVANEQR